MVEWVEKCVKKRTVNITGSERFFHHSPEKKVLVVVSPPALFLRTLPFAKKKVLHKTENTSAK